MFSKPVLHLQKHKGGAVKTCHFHVTNVTVCLDKLTCLTPEQTLLERICE